MSDVKFLNIKEFYSGISPSRKLGPRGSFQFAKAIDYRDEGTEFHLQPKAIKVSGSVVTGRVKWIVSGAPYDTNIYFYDENGVIYREDSGGVWSILQTTSNSKGQGMEVFQDYLYYSQNTQVGRYGPLSGTPSFTDNWATGYEDTSLIGFAPIKQFTDKMMIGHGNYLAVWDASVIPTNGTAAEITQLHKIQFNPGSNARCLEMVDEYLAIGTQFGTDILKNETGYVFYWDGASDTFNFFASTDNGGVNALGNSNNRLLSLLGQNSKLFINYRPFQPIQRIPKLTTNKYCEVWPGATTTWQNLVYFGLTNTDSADIQQGAYSWGRTSSQYPESLSYDFPISTGNTGVNVSVSALKGLGDYLYMAWKDGSSYGVDKVSVDGDLIAEGEYESLVFGEMSRNNQALTIKASHYPLRTGESVQIGYRLDRYSDYQFPESANFTVDSFETRLPVKSSDSIYFEIEFIIKIAQTNNTSPTVIFCGAKYETLNNQTNDW